MLPNKNHDFSCVGVMYSGEYDACDVTLSVYPHRSSLKNIPDHGGNRTYDLWNTGPMLCQPSYAVWSVRVYDISEQNLVPSISMLSNNNHDFSSVGVMYSGEYDACDVTLSAYPHRASFKNMPDHGGNRTYDLWNTSPMLCQLSYAVWSVRVCDISEQNLVPSISMLSNKNHDFSCVGVMYSGEYDACDVTLSVYPHSASLKNMTDHGGNRTYDLWNTSPMLCLLSYAVWSVRVCDISEQNLVASISMLSNNNDDFSCVGVMYSGEYDACDVTLSVYPHRASLKNRPDHGGNRSYDLRSTSPMPCQLSYAVWSVRVCDISEKNLVPSISMLSNNNHDFSCVGVMYSGEYDACDVTLSVYPHTASLKNMPNQGGNRSYDLRNTSSMLYQLSYAVWSVQVCDIS